MTQAELDALKALADAATPGPWLTNGWYDGIRYSILFSANERFTETLAYNLNREDAAFIAATRAAVPALIAEVERLRVELADVLEIAIARGDSLGYESMDYCARLEQLRPDSEILAA